MGMLFRRVERSVGACAIHCTNHDLYRFVFPLVC